MPQSHIFTVRVSARLPAERWSTAPCFSVLECLWFILKKKRHNFIEAVAPRSSVFCWTIFSRVQYLKSSLFAGLAYWRVIFLNIRKSKPALSSRHEGLPPRGWWLFATLVCERIFLRKDCTTVYNFRGGADWNETSERIVLGPIISQLFQLFQCTIIYTLFHKGYNKTHYSTLR